RLPYSFFLSSRRRHTRLQGDWSSDVCSSDLSPNLRPSSACPATPKPFAEPASVSCPAWLTSPTTRKPTSPNPASPRHSPSSASEIGRASCRESAQDAPPRSELH